MKQNILFLLFHNSKKKQKIVAIVNSNLNIKMFKRDISER